MAKYELSDQGRDDLSEIFEYIASDNESAALRVVIRFLDLFELLEQNPRIGRSRDDLQEGLRSIPQSSYMVFYRIWAGRVVIVRVLHAARDIAAVFS